MIKLLILQLGDLLILQDQWNKYAMLNYVYVLKYIVKTEMSATGQILKTTCEFICMANCHVGSLDSKSELIIRVFLLDLCLAIFI